MAGLTARHWDPLSHEISACEVSGLAWNNVYRVVHHYLIWASQLSTVNEPQRERHPVDASTARMTSRGAKRCPSRPHEVHGFLRVRELAPSFVDVDDVGRGAWENDDGPLGCSRGDDGSRAMPTTSGLTVVGLP